MKNIIWLAILLLMLGCATGKQTAWLVGGVVATGILISSSGGSDTYIEKENCFFHMNSDGSTSTICR